MAKPPVTNRSWLVSSGTLPRFSGGDRSPTTNGAIHAPASLAHAIQSRANPILVMDRSIHRGAADSKSSNRSSRRHEVHSSRTTHNHSRTHRPKPTSFLLQVRPLRLGSKGSSLCATWDHPLSHRGFARIAPCDTRDNQGEP